MRKILYLTFIYISILNFGQIRDLPKNIQAPNTSSLGKYGDIPMDLSTGRANVNIPLYSLNEGNIPLEIGLSYDTGGVRVNDVPGWVGQNWTLKAGGAIMRSVKGTTFDECNVDTQNISSLQKGYYYYTHKLNNSSWDTKSYMIDLIRRSKGAAPGELVLEEINADYEPDIFTFNFLGYSGKFFLGEDGQWKVSSNDNIKVIINMSDNVQPNNIVSPGNNYNQYVYPKSIGKITLLDDKGNRFVFGGTQEAIEYSFPDFFNQAGNRIVANSWYLREVYNKYNKLIYSFTYERGDYIASFFDVNSWSAFRKTYDGGLFQSGIGCMNGTPRTNQIFAGGQLIIPSYLKQIKTSESVTINFNSVESNSLKYGANDLPIIDRYDDFRNSVFNGGQGTNWASIDDAYFYFIRRKQSDMTLLPTVNGGNSHIYPYLEALKWRKLASIVVSGKFKSLMSANFTYNDNPNSRLRLDHLLIDDEKKYSFEYKKFDDLPLFTSRNIDHFGYYKATPFIINHDNPQSHEASRQTDPNTVDYGALERLIYPTGGYTSFYYEPHQYSKSVGNDIALHPETGIIGGIRINKIRDFSDVNNPVLKKFYYTTNLQTQNSSGILLQKNNYFIQDYQIPTINNIPYYETHFSISPVIYMSNLMGPQIEYSSVIETNNNGYIVNKYNTFENYPDSSTDSSLGNSLNIFNPHTEYGYKRGNLKSREFFNNQGGKVKEEEFLYTESPSQNARAFNYRFLVPCGSLGSLYEPVFAGTAYKLMFSDFNLTGKVSRDFFSNGMTREETETYNYTSRETFGDNFLKEKTQVTPDKIYKQEYKYPYDYPTIAANNALVINREFPLVEKKTILNNIPVSLDRANYDFVQVANQSVTLLALSSESRALLSSLQSTSIQEDKVVSYDLYDEKGNLLQYTEKSGASTTMVFGYDKTLPIAKIQGAKYNDIAPYIAAIVNKSDSIQPYYTENELIKELENFRNNPNLRNYQITTYTYYPSIGLSTMTPPSGIMEKYIYDDKNRLKQIVNSNNFTLKEFNYKYTNQVVPKVYFNSLKSKKIIRNNCGSNSFGENYNYVVPEDKYSSIISQDDADQLAQNDINTNGQNVANSNGTCTPVSCSIIKGNQINQFNYGTISLNNSESFRVKISFLYETNNAYWNQGGAIIGKINGNCIPSSLRTSGAYFNGIWNLTIDANGYIKASVASASPSLVNNTTVVLDFTFSIY